MLSKGQFALIHVARAQLKLSDDEYRKIIFSVCGVNTSKDIKTLDDFSELVKAFKKLGFQPKKAYEDFSNKRRMAEKTISKEQIALIETLWQKVTKTPETWRESLNSFLAARFNALNVESLSGMKAINVIEALKDMMLKTALVQVHENIFVQTGLNIPDPSDSTLALCKALDVAAKPVVQNKLLELFKTVNMCFSQEEFAALFASLIYQDSNLMERCKTAAAKFQSKMSHQPTGE